MEIARIHQSNGSADIRRDPMCALFSSSTEVRAAAARLPSFRCGVPTEACASSAQFLRSLLVGPPCSAIAENVMPPLPNGWIVAI